MEISQDLLQAAKTLGELLAQNPAVQDYLQADADVRGSAEIQRMQSEADEIYQALVARQQSGEVVHPHEVNDYYNLREQIETHPLMVRRSECLQVVKTLFGETSSMINSIISVDFSEFARK